MTAPGSRLSHLECSRCSSRHDASRVQQRCRACGGTLFARYDLGGVRFEDAGSGHGGTRRYRELLPLQGSPVSLGEPETPLLSLPCLSRRWGVDVYLKDDGMLPGGTFKARGACVALSRAVELGVRKIVMPTAGNAGGTWALYAARAGIDLTVTMARSAPRANQAEVRAAGATLELVDGSIFDAGERAKEIAATTGAFLASTFSEPYRLEGKKVAWFEVFAQLGDGIGIKLPRTIVLPVGGGVAAVAVAKAVAEVTAAGWLRDGDGVKLVGVQPEECAPIARAFEARSHTVTPWDGDPIRTMAAGLRVPHPAEGALVLKTIRESGGTMTAVSERAIREAITELTATEGVFACPEGAATVAAAGELAAAAELEGPLVLYNTGAGAKYADALVDQ